MSNKVEKTKSWIKKHKKAITIAAVIGAAVGGVALHRKLNGGVNIKSDISLPDDFTVADIGRFGEMAVEENPKLISSDTKVLGAKMWFEQKK